MRKKRAHIYYKKGLKYFRQKDFFKAINCFGSQLKVTPRHISSYYYMGRALFLLKNYSAAYTYFKVCSRQSVDNVYFNYYMGRVLLHLGEVEQAVGCLRRASMGLKGAIFYIALALYRINDYKGALEQLEELPVSLLSRKEVIVVHSAILFNIGNQYYNSGDLEEASTYFVRSIEINERAYPAYFQMGSLSFERGEYRRALSYLEHIYPEFRDNEALNISLAYLYNLTSQYSKLEQLLKIGNINWKGLGDIKFKKILALTLYRNKKYKEAIPLFISLYKSKDYDSGLLYHLAQSRQATGDNRRALNCYGLIFKITKANSTINNSYLLLLIRLNRYSEAREEAYSFIKEGNYNNKTVLFYYYSSVFSGFIKNFDALYNRLAGKYTNNTLFVEATARYYLDREDKERAVAAYYKLYSLIPEDEHTLKELVELFLTRGLYNQAIYYLEKMYKLEPNNGTTLYYYAYFLLKGGYNDKAIEILKAYEQREAGLYLLLSEAYLRKGEKKMGYSLLKKSFFMDPLYLPAQYKTVLFFYKVRKFKRAFNICEIMGRSSPRFRRYLLYQSIILARVGDFSGAKTKLKSYIAGEKNKSRYLLYLLAALYYKAGSYKTALALLGKLNRAAGKESGPELVLKALCQRKLYDLEGQKRSEALMRTRFSASPTCREYIDHFWGAKKGVSRQDVGIRLFDKL